MIDGAPQQTCQTRTMPAGVVGTDVGDAERDAALAAALAVLHADGVVAVPTETVYGLAARGLSPKAVAQIFAAKGRPSDNPLILHVKDLASAWPLWRFSRPAVDADRATRLAAAFWPGPLTIVALASPLVPEAVRGGLSKVAVRVPSHPFALALSAALGEPFAAPSANASGRPSPTSADDVRQSLDGRVPLIIDGGHCSRGIESSVVDVTGARPRLLRPGAISVLDLRKVLPDLDVRAPGAATHLADASPGLRHRHYAPLGGARLLPAHELVQVWDDADVGVIARSADVAALPRRGAGFCALLPDDVDGYGRELFAALYQAERAAPRRLVVVDVPTSEGWLAVRDRLLRATAE